MKFETAFANLVNDALNENEKNGWEPNMRRLEKLNDGWAIVELSPHMSGTPRWVVLAFTRDKKSITKAFKKTESSIPEDTYTAWEKFAHPKGIKKE